MNEARFGRSPSLEDGDGAGESREAIMNATLGDGEQRGRSGSPRGGSMTAAAAAKQAQEDMWALHEMQDDRPEPPKLSPGSVVSPQPSNLLSEVNEGSQKRSVVSLGDEVSQTSSRVALGEEVSQKSNSVVSLGEAATSALRDAALEAPAKPADEPEPPLKETL